MQVLIVALGISLIGGGQALADSALRQLSTAYQMDYVVQKNLPPGTSSADRDRIERQIFAPAFTAIGHETARKYSDLFNSQNNLLKNINKHEKNLRDAGNLRKLSEADRKKKMLEISGGKMGALPGKDAKGKGPGAAVASGGQKREGPAAAEGDDGAKTVDFGSSATKSPAVKRNKDGIIDF